MAASPLWAQYVGSQACAECHPGQFASQSKTGHARALALAPPGSPGRWAFGAGEKATTYVSQKDQNTYVEHGLTYYAGTRAFGPTPGHQGSEDRSYPTFEPGASIPRCFRCHSTGQPSLGPGFSIQPRENGVRCEACHGPGAAHVESGGAPGTIRNPKNLNAVELNGLCGACHRKPAEPGEQSEGRVAVGLRFDWSNTWNTRHQPIYLSQSACFRNSGGTLSCLTCHDPHAPIAREAASYDRRCLSCHPGVRHQSVAAADRCTTCHMPSVQTATPLSFANHWIGVYAPGNPLRPRPVNAPPLALPATAAAPGVLPDDVSALRPLYEQALAARKLNADIARGATDLGLFLKEAGQLDDAVAVLRKALAIDRKLGRLEESRAEERLAQALQAAGRSTEAVNLFRQSAGSADARVAAASYAALARLEPARAIEFYELAIPAEEKASGKDHPRVAVLLSNLALLREEKREYRAAEALLRRALAIQEQSLGRTHYQTATTLSNLGVLLYNEGRLKDAESPATEAVRTFEVKRPGSAELAAAYRNLSKLLEAGGDRVTAAGYLWKSVAVHENLYGADAPEVAAALIDLAVLLRGNHEEIAAQSLLARALRIYESRFGPDSPQARDLRTLTGTR